MKTLADFKRALTMGSKWEAQHIPSGATLGIREVAIVNTNRVAFWNSAGKMSWLYFPSAKHFRVNEKGQAEIYWEDGTHVLTYTKV